MASRHVVFSHGLESGPWGTKISAMSEVAKSEGWNVDSVDYRGVSDARDRVTRLLSFCRDLRGDLVLVGSSMGGYVATLGVGAPARARTVPDGARVSTCRAWSS
jgi:predicted esterase YcpF (UPF0227 family)